MTVEIGITVGKECKFVTFSIFIYLFTKIIVYKSLLLMCFSDVFNRISTPNLPLFDDSSRRNNAIRSNNRSRFKDSSFHNDRVMSNINTSFDSTRVEGAIILNNIISIEKNFGSKTSW